MSFYVFQGVVDPRTVVAAERTGSSWENRYLSKEHRRAGATFQGKVYNFLERPTGWKCFVYHFTVWVNNIIYSFIFVGKSNFNKFYIIHCITFVVNYCF